MNHPRSAGALVDFGDPRMHLSYITRSAEYEEFMSWSGSGSN